MTDKNPMQVIVEELADEYVALVQRLADEIAPQGPWWQADLSPDEELWRWEGSADKPGPRIPVLTWLMTAGVYMGYESPDEVMAHIEDFFLSPHAPDVIPPEMIADPAQNEGFILLLEMGQASGWVAMANHIRKVERMHARKLESMALLANKDQPRIPLAPAAPPPMPVELVPGTAGWPNYGMVPQDPASGHGTAAAPSLAGSPA